MKKIPVHQLVLLAFKGVRPSIDMLCRHLNGNCLDNNPDNLQWGTTKENAQDSIRHGTAVCLRLGEEHPGAKTKQSTVIRIKQLIQQGHCNKEIALMTGLKAYNIRDIRVGKAWKHLTISQGAYKSFKPLRP